MIPDGYFKGFLADKMEVTVQDFSSGIWKIMNLI